MNKTILITAAGFLSFQAQALGTLYAVNGSSQIYKMDGDSGWAQMPVGQMPGKARTVGVNAKGDLWAVNAAGAIFGWRDGDWRKTQGSQAKRIAVDPDGNPWIVNSVNKIYSGRATYSQADHRLSTQWTLMPGAATDIAIGAEGSIYVVGRVDNQAGGSTAGDGGDPDGSSPVGGASSNPGSGPDPIVANSTTSGGSQGSGSSDGDPSSDSGSDQSSSSADATESRGSQASGSPAGDGGIYKWSSQGWVKDKIGKAVRVAVGSKGELFAVTSGGTIFYKASEDLGWLAIKGDASAIAAGIGGLFTVGRTDGNIYQRKAGNWRRIEEKGIEIATK